LTTSEATLSLPVVNVKLPVVVSLFDAAFDPAGRPASSTLLSAPRLIVGIESFASVRVTVAVDVSPSPSVIV